MTSLGQKKASPSPFKTPNKASQNPESALGGAKDTVSGATDTGGDTVSGAADQAPGPAKDAGKTAGGTTKDLGSKTSESAPKPPATPKTAAKPPVSPKTAAKPPVSPKTAQKAPVTPKKAPKPKEAVGTSSTGKKVEKNTDKIQKQGKLVFQYRCIGANLVDLLLYQARTPQQQLRNETSNLQVQEKIQKRKNPLNKVSNIYIRPIQLHVLNIAYLLLPSIQNLTTTKTTKKTKRKAKVKTRAKAKTKRRKKVPDQ